MILRIDIGPFDDADWNEVAHLMLLMTEALPADTPVPIITLVVDEKGQSKKE